MPRQEFKEVPTQLSSQEKLLDNLPDKEYVKAVNSRPSSEINWLMVSEKERRRTFRSTWKYEDKVKGGELAKAGLYYLNKGDSVKCPFCNGVIKEWKDGDNPMIEHKKHFPNCKYVKGKATNNIPLNEKELPGSQQITNKSNGDNNTDSAQSALTVSRQLRPEFRIQGHRELTFGLTWLSELRSLVPKICEAGFFLEGTGTDKCVCFYCGGTLEDWTINDDPWAEHAKWYYKCPYLIETKTVAYIQEIRGTMSKEDREDSECLKYGDDHSREIDSRGEGFREFTFYHMAQIDYREDEIIDTAYRLNECREFNRYEDLCQMIDTLRTSDDKTGTDKQENEETEFKFETTTPSERPVESKHPQFEDLVLNHRNETISADEIKKAEQLMRRCPSCQQTLNIKYYKPCDDKCLCECPGDPEFCPVCHEKITEVVYGYCYKDGVS